MKGQYDHLITHMESDYIIEFEEITNSFKSSVLTSLPPKYRRPIEENGIAELVFNYDTETLDEDLNKIAEEACFIF